jgi:hypothetical protein
VVFLFFFLPFVDFYFTYLTHGLRVSYLPAR